jgi:hypothetical protein
MRGMIFVLAAMIAQPALADRLSLVCVGTATVDVRQRSYASAYDYTTGKTVGVGGVSRSDARIEDRVSVVLADGSGKIRAPALMNELPTFHEPAEDGWWSLYELQETPDRITGRFKISVLRKPVVSIDRHSGEISISGTKGIYAFNGICTPDDTPPDAKKF